MMQNIFNLNGNLTVIDSMEAITSALITEFNALAITEFVHDYSIVQTSQKPIEMWLIIISNLQSIRFLHEKLQASSIIRNTGLHISIRYFRMSMINFNPLIPPPATPINDTLRDRLLSTAKELHSNELLQEEMLRNHNIRGIFPCIDNTGRILSYGYSKHIVDMILLVVIHS
jgi:hypothetical protein